MQLNYYLDQLAVQIVNSAWTGVGVWSSGGIVVFLHDEGSNFGLPGRGGFQAHRGMLAGNVRQYWHQGLIILYRDHDRGEGTQKDVAEEAKKKSDRGKWAGKSKSQTGF